MTIQQVPSPQVTVRSETLGSITAPRSARKHDGLLTDTINLLDHQKYGHMGMWAYLNGGRPHLEAFFQSPNYDGQKEVSFIPKIAAQFARELPDKITLIELGPGRAYERKTAPFIDSFKEAMGIKKRIVEYQAIDIVQEYADDAAAFIQKTYNIDSSSFVGDYTKIQHPLDTLGTPVVISWNTPIWNAEITPNIEPDFQYASNLKKIGQLVGPQGIALITHFPLVAPEKTLEKYLDENCKNAVLAIPALIQNRLSPVCKKTDSEESIEFKDAFDYDVKIDINTQYVSMDLVSRHNLDVSLGEYKTYIKQGERFNAVRSAKPSVRLFNEIANYSGAKVLNMVQTFEGDVVAQAIQFPNAGQYQFNK